MTDKRQTVHLALEPQQGPTYIYWLELDEVKRVWPHLKTLVGTAMFETIDGWSVSLNLDGFSAVRYCVVEDQLPRSQALTDYLTKTAKKYRHTQTTDIVYAMGRTPETMQ